MFKFKYPYILIYIKISSNLPDTISRNFCKPTLTRIYKKHKFDFNTNFSTSVPIQVQTAPNMIIFKFKYPYGLISLKYQKNCSV